MTLRAHLFDFLLYIAHAPADATPLDLDLLLTKTTARSNSAAPPTDLTVIGIRADKSWQQVMQTRSLDLQAAFMRARMLRKDLEDDLGPVEDTRLHIQLEVALLARAQIFVADDDVERAFELHVAQLFYLAHTYEVRRVDLAAALHVRSHDLSACGPRQVSQLGHLVAHDFGTRAGEQHPDEINPLARALRRDQSLSFLIRVMASSSRTSGAVTDSRK
jgi:hypothetical protein